MVENIPAQVFSVIINGEYYPVEAVSEELVIIRVADEILHVGDKINLGFFSFFWGDRGFEKSAGFSGRVMELETREFDFKVTIIVEADDYKGLFNEVTAQYYEYIKFKLSMMENQLEQRITESNEAFIDARGEAIDGFICPPEAKLAVALENPVAYKKYLENEIKLNYSRVYIGNAFCHNLCPSETELKNMLAKAKAEKTGVTFVTTYLRKEILEEFEGLFYILAKTDVEVEIEINDFGWLKYFQEADFCFELSLGRLLNKRRQDPRIMMKNNWESMAALCTENSLNDEDYLWYLKKKGISRAELEACGYEVKIPKLTTSIHLPFYHTNVSQKCPLYALVENGSRAKQTFVCSCPRYCQSYELLYEENSNAIGRYNGIFGFDDQILTDSELLKKYIDDGVDRIVWNLV